MWLDEECTYKRPDDNFKDLGLGFQTMDAVYEESTFQISVLTTSLKLSPG